MSRWDSAAIVPKTSELLPDPETPVNTVSRRFGSSTVTSLRLFTRAPCTRIRSWRSAGGAVSIAEQGTAAASVSVDDADWRRSGGRAQTSHMSGPVGAVDAAPADAPVAALQPLLEIRASRAA